MKYGPSQGELKLRLGISIFGLGLMAVALLTRGFGGIAAVEVVLIAGTFFGGTAVWSARALLRKDDR
jgi:succinate-acetate transporter protein